MDPINYSSMLTQLDVTPLLQGLQLGRQKDAAEVQQQQQQQKIDIARQEEADEAAKTTAWNEDVASYMKDPTTQGVQNLLLKHPERTTALKELANQQTESQKTRNIQAAMRLGGFLNNGLTDLALKDLQQRKAALAETGESTEITDAAIEAIKAGDINKAKGIAGLVIGGTLGADAGGVLDQLGFSDKARRDAARDDREEKRLSLAEDRNARDERRTESLIASTNAATARADRKASGGGQAGGGYEYRVGPNGKLQRRKL